MDSTNILNQIEANQAQKEVTANENFAAASPSMFYARNAVTSAGLTWGYYGGRFLSSSIANGTLTLAASSTTYIVASLSTGAVSQSTSTTNWNDTVNYARLYKVVTGATTVSSYEDHRQTVAVPAAAGSATIAQNSQSAAYTLVLTDAGKHLLHPSADTTARIFTIPANSSVAFPIGTPVTFVNQNGAGVITIAITTDTMRLAGAGTTGSRTLAANGIATALKLTSTEWIISGTGLT